MLPLRSGMQNLWSDRFGHDTSFPESCGFCQNLSLLTKISIPKNWHNGNLTYFTHKKSSMSRPLIWYKLQVIGQNSEFLVNFSLKGMRLDNFTNFRAKITKNCDFFLKISTLKCSAYPSTLFWHQPQVDRQRGSVMPQNCLCLTDFVIGGDTLCLFLGNIACLKK